MRAASDAAPVSAPALETAHTAAACLAHAAKVEALRPLADLAGMGGRFDNDLVIPEGCAQVRYLVSGVGQVPGAVAALERWQEMTQRQAAWVQTLADRHVAQGRRLWEREKLLRAEIQLRQTAQAAELETLCRRMADLQAAVEPTLLVTQRALPGAAGDHDLPEDMQGARWETIAAALEDVSIPTLMLSMVHMTGDPSIIRGELKPQGLFLNEVQGYMSDQDKAAARALIGDAGIHEPVADDQFPLRKRRQNDLADVLGPRGGVELGHGIPMDRAPPRGHGVDALAGLAARES